MTIFRIKMGDGSEVAIGINVGDGPPPPKDSVAAALVSVCRRPAKVVLVPAELSG